MKPLRFAVLWLVGLSLRATPLVRRLVGIGAMYFIALGLMVWLHGAVLAWVIAGLIFGLAVSADEAVSHHKEVCRGRH